MPGPVLNWYQSWTLTVLLLWHICGWGPAVSVPVLHAIIPQTLLQNRARDEKVSDQQRHYNAIPVSLCGWRSLDGGQESLRANSAAAAMSLPRFLKKFAEKKDMWLGRRARRSYSGYSEKDGNSGLKFQSSDASEVAFTVKDVTVNNSSLLPKEVIVQASIRSGLLDNPFNLTNVETCADMLNQWYEGQGYLFSKVVRANSYTNGVVALEVNEPVLSPSQPVSLRFYKRDDASDPNASFSLINADDAAKRRRWIPRSLWTPRSSPKRFGKTRPETIAAGLGLMDGPVRLDPERLLAVGSSELYDAVSVTGAHELEDGVTVEVGIVERKTCAFDPEISKTLFDSGWSGGVKLEERNFFGRNIAISLEARRVLNSAFTYFTMACGCDRFGRPGAWTTSFFRDSVTGETNLSPGPLTNGQCGDYQLSSLASVLPIFGLEKKKRLQKGQKERYARHGLVFESKHPFLGCATTTGGGVEIVSPMDRSGSRSQIIFGWTEFARRLTFIMPAVWRSRKETATCETDMESGQQTHNRVTEEKGNIMMVDGHLKLTNGAHIEGPSLTRPFAKVDAMAIQKIPLSYPRIENSNRGVQLAFRQKLLASSSNTPLHHMRDLGGRYSIRGVSNKDLGPVDLATVFTGELRCPLPVHLPSSMSVKTHIFVDAAGFHSRQGGRDTITSADLRRQQQKIATEDNTSRVVDSKKAAVCTGGETTSATALWNSEHSPSLLSPKNGKFSGLTMRTTQGVGFTLGDTIQIDVPISRGGPEGVNVRLRDPLF